MGELPSVLAGPILRRVDLGRVNVWIALKERASVTVTVFRGREASTGPGTTAGIAVGSGTRQTRSFGPSLHVAVVDVEATLIPGSRFCYDVVVDSGSGGKGLKELGLLADKASAAGNPGRKALGYADNQLPSFVTTPASVADLRIVHTSCRKSNGSGPDALSWLDERVEEGLSNNDEAPQMLFLTGDQIYADDVGGVLLPMLAEIGTDLVGAEKMSYAGTFKPVTLTEFPALRRQQAVRVLGRLTTTDGANHLLGFGEFAAMYCAAFSPEVWRPLPTAASLFGPLPGTAAVTHVSDFESFIRDPTEFAAWKAERIKAYDKEAKRVEQWRDAVPRVARVLANVPTYMIFDDHEVTDDWNISRRWRDRVIAAPFGRGIVRNGLMSYAIFQGWGNDPAKFRSEPGVPPAQRHANEKLLEAVSAHCADLNDPIASQLDTVDQLLGIDKPVTAPKCEFHYEVKGTTFQVRVLDTRTRRTHEGSRLGPAKLLGGSLNAQLPAGPFTDGRELLVVVSPVPVLFPRLFDKLLQPLAATVFDLKTHMFGREKDDGDPSKITGLLGSEHKDVEGWGADEVHFEQLVRRLGSYPRVVVLSGDVHFASSLTLDFWAKGNDVRDSRIVQCTSSAARNQPGDTERALLRTLRISQQLLRGLPAERIGWDGDHGVKLPAGASIRPGRRGRLRRKPAILPAAGWPTGTTVDQSKPPDWRWRLEVLRDERPHTALPAGAPDIPVLDWNAGDPVASYAAIAGRHQQVGLDVKDPVRLMVFLNNVGVLTFGADGGDYRVRHALLSTADDDTGEAFTEHDVRFAPATAPTAPILRTV